MNNANTWLNGLTALLGIILLTTLVGCVGYVGDGYGGAVVETGPVLIGGPYERGPIVRGYAHRGFASRGFAHGGGRR